MSRQSYAVLDALNEGYAMALINILEKQGSKELAKDFKKLALSLGKTEQWVEDWISFFNLDKK